MLGKANQLEPKLFYHGVSLERRIGPDHPLRKIKKLIDFNFIRSQVKDLYGEKGNQSVDPAVILKLIFLLFYENIKSERLLMRQLPLRMDWLWFCDYDIDDTTPNHSVLSKARARWGTEVFEQFFINVLNQCITAGLVDGETVHIDASFIDGNADIDKVQPNLHLITKKLSERFEDDVQEQPEEIDDTQAGHASDDFEISGDTPNTKISPTDPDARIGRKYGKSTLGYKDHRVVDDNSGVITATVTTAANVNDDKVMAEAFKEHTFKTGTKIKTAVADKGYGTTANYKYLHENNINSCIPHQKHGVKSNTAFSHDKFIYDRQNDCYICPAGNILTRYDHERPHGGAYRYLIERDKCQQCEFLNECVSSKTRGRLIRRNADAEYVEWADNCFSKHQRKRLLSRRMYKAEGSFAIGSNDHGFKRARWRGLVKVRIQNLVIATVQNIGKLMRWRGEKVSSPVGSRVQSTVIDQNFVKLARFLGRLVLCERILSF